MLNRCQMGASLGIHLMALVSSRDNAAFAKGGTDSDDAVIIGRGSSGQTRRESELLDRVAGDHITAVLERCNWRISGRGNAAEVLGLQPNTLRSRMKKLAIVRPDRRLE